MRNFYKFSAALILITGIFHSPLFAQNDFFIGLNESRIELNKAKRVITPNDYKAFVTDLNEVKQFLSTLPDEKAIANKKLAPVMTLPMPDGHFGKFNVWESSIQEPALQAKFPEIRTFAGQGIDDPFATIRFDIGPRGFHAQILTVNGTYYIDPYAVGLVNEYIVYYKRNLIKHRDMQCFVSDDALPPVLNTTNSTAAAGPCRGTQLYTYRLAVACTGEYAQAPGISAGTNAAVLHAAIVTTVNRVVGVYEKEVSVRLVLVANNDLVEFLNATTDPFNGNNNAGTLINESQTVIDANIGPANYDIGHTFSTGGGGLAQLGCVCGSSKARGITGSPAPTGDAYDIDYVAHEVGHQFGGSHTFNSTTSSCSGNRSATSAYEVGSGTTIQAYAGICGSDNTQPNSDPFFHTRSFDQISSFLEAGGASCRTVTPTGNTLPTITAMNNNTVAIPISTPFTLSGTATDADGDALTYCWEEWDLGPATTWNGGNANSTSPLFKSRIPKTTGQRTFPDMAVILAGYPANPAATMGGLKGETLPTVTRALKFRLTVRDNKAGGGGVVTGGDGCQTGFTPIFLINVAGTTPFAVTVPNGGESYPGNSTQTITWDPAATNAAPFSVSNVRISLSTDGGLTYPTIILASTPNDGSESVTIPAAGPTTTARIKIEALGNIFFDISNANFSITAPVGPTFTISSAAPATGCVGAASVTSSVTTNPISGFSSPITFSASGNPAGTTVSFSPNPVTPGNSTTVTLGNTSALAPGSYTVNVTANGGAVTQNATLTFIITSSSSITTQPLNTSGCSGGAVVFSTAASGAGLTYQWQLSTTGCGGTFTDIPGAVNAVYTVTGLTNGMNGYAYQVVVSGTCGAPVTSNCAALTITQFPSIATQPTSQTVCAGSAVTFTTAATGTSVSYQWQVSTDGGITFTNIPGAINDTYTIASPTVAQSGYIYKVIVTNTCGNVSSNSVTLTVNASNSITTQPASVSICSGTSTTFAAMGNGTNINYQWQVSTTGCAGSFVNISGANAATYTVNGVTTAMNGYAYRVVVGGSCGANVISNCAVLTVFTTAIINAQPMEQSACAGNPATFSVSALGTGLAYQWQVSTNGGTTFVNIPGATAAAYTIPVTQSTQNGNRYRVLVTSTCSPSGTMSSVVMLTISNPVTIVKAPDSVKGCIAGAATFRVYATGTGLSYQWQYSNAATGTFSNVPGATDSFLVVNNLALSQNNTWYRVVVTGNPCGLRVTEPVKLIVSENPEVTLHTTWYALTPNTPAVLYPTTNQQAYFTYQWIKDTVLTAFTGTQLTVGVDSIGIYKVVGKNTVTGCSDTSNVILIFTLSSEQLYIYPSPTKGQFQIRYYDATKAAKRNINIFDYKGAVVFRKEIKNSSSYQRIDVDFSGRANGIYVVELQDSEGNRLASGKVMVQH